jgi:protein-S-isoprenylcysteine O-methyltransferase Ste14
MAYTWRVTALKSILFLILVPGLVAGYIPLVLLSSGSRIETGFLASVAFPLWLMGGAILLWSFWNFFQEGHGTPAPLDPPTELVAVGFYRYVRNPMYFGILLILAGYFLWFGTWALFIYVVLFFVITHLFVVLYEEPNLKRRFGVSYEEYRRQVPRWIPRPPR